MTRAQLEHIIRAAGTIAEVNEVVVIESQAIFQIAARIQADFAGG